MKRLVGLLVVFVGLGASCVKPTQLSLVTLPGPMVWGAVQSAADTAVANWQWLAADVALSDAAANSVVVPVWPYALWDQAVCHGDYSSSVALYGDQFQAPYAPCNTTQYSAWLTEAVKRYQAPVAGWQVLYEPDKQTAPLAQYQDTTEAYLNLLDVTQQAIHAADSNAVVVSGLVPQLDTDSLLFWGPVLQSSQFNEFIDVVAVAADTAEEWTATQSVLERYHITKPAWVFSSVKDTKFAGAERVVYTGE